MEPVRSSLGGGAAATVVLSAFLFVADALLPGSVFAVATFASLCTVGGPPYCDLGSQTALLTALWFLVLYAVAWPLFFAGFTWGIPGESGVAHGVLFGLVLWAGFLVTLVFGAQVAGGPLSNHWPTVAVTAAGYSVYGAVLGGTYDVLAGHRTFLSAETE
jgi:hypothetical protein